jgi:hypothetical protein
MPVAGNSGNALAVFGTPERCSRRPSAREAWGWCGLGACGRSVIAGLGDNSTVETLWICA